MPGLVIPVNQVIDLAGVVITLVDVTFWPGDSLEGEEVRGIPTVQVTAKWGYSAVVPPTITKACEMQVVRWYKRFEGAMADALASAELGQLLYRQELDPDVKFILVGGRYVKPSVGRRY
jgi:hypothetical protein